MDITIERTQKLHIVIDNKREAMEILGHFKDRKPYNFPGHAVLLLKDRLVDFIN
jgi:hypothetical protein